MSETRELLVVVVVVVVVVVAWLQVQSKSIGTQVSSLTIREQRISFTMFCVLYWLMFFFF